MTEKLNSPNRKEAQKEKSRFKSTSPKIDQSTNFSHKHTWAWEFPPPLFLPQKMNVPKKILPPAVARKSSAPSCRSPKVSFLCDIFGLKDLFGCHIRMRTYKRSKQKTKDEENKYLNKTIEEHKVKFDMNEDLIDVNTRKNEEHKCLNTKYMNTSLIWMRTW